MLKMPAIQSEKIRKARLVNNYETDLFIIRSVRTGKQIEKILRQNGYTVKSLQIELGLLCPQPIYCWLSGKIMPSIDHLYHMSKLFQMHMEDFLVSCDDVSDSQNEEITEI